jgi:hypothetical protein
VRVICWRQVSLFGYSQGEETEMPKHNPRHLEREEIVELEANRTATQLTPYLLYTL